MTTGFFLNPRSKLELTDVHPRLRGVVQRAIELTTVPFMVVQGMRTPAEAAHNLAAGTSRTSNSLHLPQADGLSHAVDLGALVHDKIVWEPLDLYYAIATAMRAAAIEAGVVVRYGGCWEPSLNYIKGDIKNAVSAYANGFRHANHREPLIDAGHFELPRGVPITATVKA